MEDTAQGSRQALAALRHLADAPADVLPQPAEGLPWSDAGAQLALRELGSVVGGGMQPAAALSESSRRVLRSLDGDDPRRRAALVTLLVARAVARKHQVLPFDAATLDALATDAAFA